jgi:hypothetical protein
MSILVCPTYSDASYTQATTFEGTKYTLFFTFNQRAACWYMSIADADGVDIYNGVKLVIGPLLLAKCKDVRAPPGGLIVISSTTDTSPPLQLDLLAGSGRCTLCYITSDWLAIIQAANADPTPANVAAVAALFAQVAAGGNASNPVSTYGQTSNTVALP